MRELPTHLQHSKLKTTTLRLSRCQSDNAKPRLIDITSSSYLKYFSENSPILFIRHKQIVFSFFL